MECGTCTECCELLEVKSRKATQGKLIELIDLDKPAGTLCNYCDKNKGCSIYDERPKICRDFFCAYAQMENVSEELRPDNCGIIFEKLSDDLFLGTVRPNKEVTPHGLKQIELFNEQGFNVVLVKSTEKYPLVRLTEGSTQFEVLQQYTRLKKIANG